MRNWSREETILALDAYCKVPFNKASNSNPIIVEVATLIGRTPASVKMKIGNFGSFDPILKAKGIVGLGNTSRLDKEVWDEYCDDWGKLAYDSALIIAQLRNTTLEEFTHTLPKQFPKGEERERIIRQRIHQTFFRDAVLSSYNYRCCISGVGSIELLEACHIVDWSLDEVNRTNPRNGLCLNPFFHKAYDKHLLSITPDYSIVVSEELFEKSSELSFKDYLHTINGKSITLPDRFFPQREFLEIHYERFKTRQ